MRLTFSDRSLSSASCFHFLLAGSSIFFCQLSFSSCILFSHSSVHFKCSVSSSNSIQLSFSCSSFCSNSLAHFCLSSSSLCSKSFSHFSSSSSISIFSSSGEKATDCDLWHVFADLNPYHIVKALTLLLHR